MSDFFSKWLIPQNGAELMALGFAVLLALFFVFVSVRTEAPVPFASHPRVKALTWLVLTGGAALVLDWKGLTFDPALDKEHLSGIYGGWVVLATLAFMFLGTIAFFFEAAIQAYWHPEYRSEVLSLPVLFAAGGWASYQERRKSIEAKIQSRREKDDAEREESDRACPR